MSNCQEEQTINYINNMALIYTGIITLLILLYSIIHFGYRRFKYIRYETLPAKRVSLPILHKIFKYRIYNNLNVKNVLVGLFSVLLSVLFIVVSTPSREYWLKSSGIFLSPLIFFNSILPLRNSPLTLLIEIPYNRLFFLHRILSVFILILSILHTIFYIINYSRPILQNHPVSIRNMFDPPPRAFGTISLFLLIYIIGSSMYAIRRKFYTFFKYSHFIVLGFHVCVALHRPHFIPFLIVLGICIVINHFVFLSYAPWVSLEADTKVYDNNFLKLFIVMHSRKFTYEPGQYFYINVPAISAIAWHPFSIVSAKNANVLEFGIRDMGDYTKKLLNHARNNPTIKVKIYGPYGNFPFDYTRYNQVVMVASGIGITPFISMLRNLYISIPKQTTYIRNIYLIWLCKDLEMYRIYDEVIHSCRFQSSIDTNCPKFHVVVYFKDIKPILLGMNTIFHQYNEAHTDIIYKILESCKHQYPEPPADDEELIDIDLYSNIKSRRVLLLACGSNHLIRDVWDSGMKEIDSQYQIDFFHETFEY
jgi:predicted ferric reductase